VFVDADGRILQKIYGARQWDGADCYGSSTTPFTRLSTSMKNPWVRRAVDVMRLRMRLRRARAPDTRPPFLQRVALRELRRPARRPTDESSTHAYFDLGARQGDPIRVANYLERRETRTCVGWVSARWQCERHVSSAGRRYRSRSQDDHPHRATTALDRQAHGGGVIPRDPIEQFM